MINIASLGYEIDSSQARTAARDLDRMAASADKVERGYKSLKAASANLLRDEKGRFISAADSAAKYGAEIDALRTKYNPLYAASKQFEASQNEIKRALELGAISVGQAEAALERLNAQMVVGATTNARFGKSMESSAAHTTNLLFQFQDIGMMLAAGQNPLMLAMQQGTQVAGIFHQMGQSGQSAFSAIRGALLGMVSPMSLLTIGVIAGGAALFQWGMSALGASEDVKTFDEVLDDVANGVSTLNQIARDYSADGIQSLISQYGLLNQELLIHLERVRLVRTEQELAKNAALASTLQDSMTGGWITSDIDDIRNLFDTTNDSARRLLFLLEQIKNAKTFEEQEAALRNARDYVDDLVAGMDSTSAEAKKVQGELVLAEDAARKLAEANRKAEEAAKNIANVDMVTGISAAADQAARLARNLGISIDLANSIVAGGDDRREAILEHRAGVQDARAVRLEETQSKWMDTYGKKPKKGEGGGGAAAENAFEQLKISLEKESKFQIEKYEKDQAVLQEALKKKLTTQQEYEELTALLKTEYWGSEYEKEVARREIEQAALDEALEKKYLSQEQYNQRVAELQSQEMAMTLGHYNTLFGNMASIAQAGGDKASGVVKAFSVAQGLINSYLAYTQVLADPSLVGRPFLRTALAASTLAAGLAQVANMKSGGGGSSSSATSSATSAAASTPTRTTVIELTGGDEYMNNYIRDKLGPALYDFTKDGGVIQFA